jgi:hypothetical protein
MIKISKLLLVAIVLFGATQSVLADRGIGKKSKSKVTLNINTPASLRNSVSLNLKSGLRYTGSVFLNKFTVGTSTISKTLITYQKGNTIYIIPYKQKIIMPEMRPGYTGMKLIIKSH